MRLVTTSGPVAVTLAFEELKTSKRRAAVGAIDTIYDSIRWDQSMGHPLFGTAVWRSRKKRGVNFGDKIVAKPSADPSRHVGESYGSTRASKAPNVSLFLVHTINFD